MLSAPEILKKYAPDEFKAQLIELYQAEVTRAKNDPRKRAANNLNYRRLAATHSGTLMSAYLRALEHLDVLREVGIRIVEAHDDERIQSVDTLAGAFNWDSLMTAFVHAYHGDVESCQTLQEEGES